MASPAGDDLPTHDDAVVNMADEDPNRADLACSGLFAGVTLNKATGGSRLSERPRRAL